MGRGPNTRNTSSSVVSSDNAFDIQVGMERVVERVAPPLEKC